MLALVSGGILLIVFGFYLYVNGAVLCIMWLHCCKGNDIHQCTTVCQQTIEDVLDTLMNLTFTLITNGSLSLGVPELVLLLLLAPCFILISSSVDSIDESVEQSERERQTFFDEKTDLNERESRLESEVITQESADAVESAPAAATSEELITEQKDELEESLPPQSPAEPQSEVPAEPEPESVDVEGEHIHMKC